MHSNDKKLREVFCSNLRRFRNDLRMSQAGLAKKTGVSTNFINDLETGKKWTSLTTLSNLANSLDIEAYELLKPPNLFPDNFGSIVRKITDDIKTAVDQTRLDYMRNEADAHKKP